MIRIQIGTEFLLRITDLDTHAMQFDVLQEIYRDEKGRAAYGNSCTHCVLEEDVDEETFRFMKGMLKWDGCIDLDIGSGQSHQMHFCGLEYTDTIATVFKAIYDAGAEHIEAWER